MDPLETSMRSFNVVVGRLQAIRDGVEISANTDHSRNQALRDLESNTKLIFRPANSLPVLTDLGRAALRSWEERGFVDDGGIHELYRATVLLRHALSSRDTATRLHYQKMYSGWRRLVQLQPADYWLTDLYTMMLPCYLDQEDERGYNPFNIIVAVNGGSVSTAADWHEWAANRWPGSQLLQQLLKKVTKSHRRGGAETFRRALHLTYVAREKPNQFSALLNAWEIDG